MNTHGQRSVDRKTLRRFLKKILILASSLAFLSVASFISPGVGLTNAASRPLSTGIAASDAGRQEQIGFNRIRMAGARMTRVLVYWNTVAPQDEPASWTPTDPGDRHYDWTDVDREILMAKSAGLVPLVEIYLAPGWAERCQDPTPGICDPNPDDLARFAKAAAKRYSGKFGRLPRVRYWEPWNEPNLFLFFKPQYDKGTKVSPILYRRMLSRFSGAVKGVARSNKVVAGGLAPIERPGGLGPLDFARRLMCLKGRKHPVRDRGCKQKARFDIWANNPFTTGGPTHKSAGRDDVSLGDLPKMAKLLKAAKRAGRIKTSSKSIPFWVTEFSWDSSPPDPGGLPTKILTRWTSEAIYRAWRAGVTNFFWLTLRDWARNSALPFNETIDAGLYLRGATIEQDRAKENLRAFQFPFVAFGKKKGISIWGRTPKSTSGKVVIAYKKGAKWKRIGAVKADRNGIFRSVIKTRFTRRLARKKRNQIRATYRGGNSRAFSLRTVKYFWHPPYGSPTQ